MTQKKSNWFEKEKCEPQHVQIIYVRISCLSAVHIVIRFFYYIDSDEIPGFFLLLKNHIFIVRSEDAIFIFHV